MKKSIGSGRGSVYNILLKALQTGDKYGYEICKEIEEKTNGTYILKQPSLYSGLKRLEAQNLITSYWQDSDLGGRRHYYSLTQSGREKIENSNFSWEDTRDDIVNSLFEKSAVDKNIQDIENDLTEIKTQKVETDNLQKDIDDVITATEELAKNKQETESQNLVSNDVDSEQEAKIQENANKENVIEDEPNDLFSMFGNFSSSSDETEENNQEETNWFSAVNDEQIEEENDLASQTQIEEETELASQTQNEEETDLADQTQNETDAQTQIVKENEQEIELKQVDNVQENQTKETLASADQTEMQEQNNDVFDEQNSNVNEKLSSISLEENEDSTNEQNDSEHFDNLEDNIDNVDYADLEDITNNAESDVLEENIDNIESTDFEDSTDNVEDDLEESEQENDVEYEEDNPQNSKNETIPISLYFSEEYQGSDNDEDEQLDLFSLANDSSEKTPFEENQDNSEEIDSEEPDDYADIMQNFTTITNENEQNEVEQNNDSSQSEKEDSLFEFENLLTKFDNEDVSNKDVASEDVASKPENSIEETKLADNDNIQEDVCNDTENNEPYFEETEPISKNAENANTESNQNIENTNIENSQSAENSLNDNGENAELETSDNSLQKNSNDYLTEYRKKYLSSTSFADNSALENAQESFFKQDTNNEQIGENDSVLDFPSFDENQTNELNLEIEDETTNGARVNKSFDDNLQNDNARQVSEDFSSQNYGTSTQNVESEKPENQNIETQNFDYENSLNSNVETQNYDSSSSKIELENKQGAIDYRDIFGDLLTREQTDNSAEKFSNLAGATNFESVNQTETSENKNVASVSAEEEIKTTSKEYKDDLPRIVSKYNDINRTFVVDETQQKETNSYGYEENPFEKLDNRIKENGFNNYNVFEGADNSGGYNYSGANNSVQNNYVDNNSYVPFDKKYAVVDNNFEVPDYQIRYYKKQTQTTKTPSKFISINKLNLTCNAILCVIALLFTTITLICSLGSVSLSGFQIALFVISYVAPLCVTAFSLLKYAINKNKKALGLKPHALAFSLFFAFVLAILTISLNVCFGMNFDNILSYSASFILALCYSVLILIKPLVSKFLSKFLKFYIS